MEPQLNDVVALMDQVSKTVDNVGIMACNLYDTLILYKMPPELAGSLVRDWWNQYWINVLKTIHE